MGEGIADELTGIDLGDARLNARSKKIIERLAAHSEATINGALDTWSEAQAAYRFFDNPQVTPDKILQPHLEATVRRIQAHPVVLFLQDTTELDYTGHAAEGVRCLNYKRRLGLLHHVELAVTPDHVPLGVIATQSFDRDPATLGKRPRKTQIPIECKESFRWLEGYRHACEVAAQCPDTQIVSVADREADIYDIFVEAKERWEQHADDGPNAHYVIRAQENRSTLERDPEAGPAVFCKVRDEVAQSPLRACRTIELSRTPKRKARRATLEIRALTVEVKPPHARRGRLPSITHNVVLVQEIDGPHDGTDVCWLLLSTLPIDTVEDVLRVIDYYVARWIIEIYFRTLKGGCTVEKIQLETKDRLLNCLAFYTIIAWRIMHLTYLGRACPQTSCETMFAEHEWKPVWKVATKKALPATPPTLFEFMRLLAQLGGYNNRKHDPPPGPKALWIGMRRMLDFSAAWLAFGPEEERCV